MLAGAVRVGQLACQRNTFLKELTATVLSCEPVQNIAHKNEKSKNNSQNNKKKAADNNNNSRSNSNCEGNKSNTASCADSASTKLYELVLSNSVLFPQGGGQPCDYGTVQLTSHDHVEHPPIHITNVLRKGDLCVLHCPVELPVGAQVIQRVDWARRWDHAQHHTAQHLLSAIVEREDMMHLDTVSWSLTHPYCFIVLDIGTILHDEVQQQHQHSTNSKGTDHYTHDNKQVVCAKCINQTQRYKQHLTSQKKINDAMITKIEEACNDAIQRALPVQVNVFADKTAYAAFVSSNATACDHIGSEGNTTITVNTNSECCTTENVIRGRGIPDDVNGPIRVITIDNGHVDQCTCCGTHLTNLAQLQTLHILHQQLKGTLLKVYFVTGARALHLFHDMYWRERALTIAMEGAKAEDFVSITQRRVRELNEANKKMKRWMYQLAEANTNKLIEMLRAEKGSSCADDDSYNNNDHINNKIKCNCHEDATDGDTHNTALHTKKVARVICIRRDDVDMDYFQYIRNKLDENDFKSVILVSAWAIDCSSAAASNVIVPTRDVQGQLFITGGQCNSDGKQSTALISVIDKVQSILTGVKGGLSRMGFRGKGSLKEWKKLTEELPSEVAF